MADTYKEFDCPQPLAFVLHDKHGFELLLIGTALGFTREDGLLGMNWTPFYEKVKKEFNWRCFKVDPPYVSDNHRYVFYKYGMMPEEPTPSDIGVSGGRRLGHYFFDENAVEQGHIVYKNKELWEEVNHAMAFNDDYQPFLSAVENYQIMI